MPFTVSMVKGIDRSLEQNRTQFLWFGEVAQQLGDRTIEEARAVSKLHIAVPILRNENETFRATYDRIIRPLPYEDKLACMSLPIDMPVTSQMTKPQFSQYMEQLHAYWTGQGVFLTLPDPQAAR